MTTVLLRATLIWLNILVLAIANGAFRERVLIPRLGEAAGHVISTLMLSAAVVLVAVLTIQWIGPGTTRDAWTIGAFWLALTLAFEFLGGHYLFHTPWQTLLADYRIQDGRIWPLVLVATLIAPALAATLR